MLIFRWLRRLATSLVVLFLLATASVAGLLWLALPSAHQRAAIVGLSASVDVAFDADGIPHIHAANVLDATAALGFVHARDRLFQMELMRRTVAGRLSELAGPPTLPTDRFMRTLGLRQAALAEAAALPPEARAFFKAYARGVNAWIDARGRFAAPEFLLLGKPEQWTTADSLAWGQIMSLWLAGNYRAELARLNLAGKLPPDRIIELWPDPAGIDRPDTASLDTRHADAAGALLAALPRFPAPFTLPASASNEWAVDAAHSATGAPLLAGDPHLGFSFPGTWYLARIDTPDTTLAGATAPGVPFLVLGHNRHIAWTFTTTGADAQDIYIETPAPGGGYETPDGPRPFVVREERVAVRGAPDDVMTVRSTRHGPIISDLRPSPGGPVLALAMASLQPGDTTAAGLLDLNRATSVAEAGAAADEITALVQNLLVADPAHIGLYVTGRVPIRRAGDGSLPIPGDDGAHDWIGFAQGPDLPRYLDPPSGILVNANERIAPKDSLPFLGRDAFGDWRARRIRTVLERLPHLTPTDFTALQADTVSAYAQQLLPTLRALRPTDPAAARALALLADWNGAMDIDLPQPLIFNAWMGHFREVLLAPLRLGSLDNSHGLEFAAYVLSPAGAHWCGGDCTLQLLQSLAETTTALTARFGPDPTAWRWGAAHRAIFAHPLLRTLPVLGRFATFSIPAPGDDATVDRGGMAPGSFDAVHGAGFRGVYDLANLDASRFIATPGQSGNLFSRHASDLLARWRDGATLSIGPDQDNVSATLKLTPEPAP